MWYDGNFPFLNNIYISLKKKFLISQIHSAETHHFKGLVSKIENKLKFRIISFRKSDLDRVVTWKRHHGRFYALIDEFWGLVNGR